MRTCRSEVLPLQQGGAEQVLAMLKGGGGAQQVLGYIFYAVD